MLSYLRAFFCIGLFAFVAVVGVLFALLTFPLVGWRWKRYIIRCWSYFLVRALGVRLVVDRAPAAANLQGLVVSNHSSWLDMIVTQAVEAVRVVAKIEVLSVPVLGRVFKMGGSLCVDRRNRKTINDTNKSISDAVAEGNLVAFYPEGTTTDGTYLLPFKSNLFQPAIDHKMMVYPVALSYRLRGERTNLTSYAGDTTFMESLLSTTRTNGIEVHIAFGDPINGGAYKNRGALTLAVQEAIAQMTGLTIQVPNEEQRVSLASSEKDYTLDKAE